MARTDIKRIKSRVINVVFKAIWKRWYFVSVKGIKGRDPRGLKEEEPHVLSICFSEWNWDWKESSNFHVLSQFSLPTIDWLNGWMKTAALPVGMPLSLWVVPLHWGAAITGWLTSIFGRDRRAGEDEEEGLRGGYTIRQDTFIKITLLTSSLSHTPPHAYTQM